MNTYQYIIKELTKERFFDLVKLGIISTSVATSLEIYEWHISHGRSQRLTAEHFRMSVSSIGYAVRKMEHLKL